MIARINETHIPVSRFDWLCTSVMLRLLHLIAPYLAVAVGESVREQGSAGEGPCWRSVVEVASKNLLGEKFFSKSRQECYSCCSVFRVSLTQQAIFVEVVEEECPTQTCGRIIKSFNLSMPDRT